MKSWLVQKLSHLGMMELGFASLLPASPMSVQEEVTQKPQKGSVCLQSVQKAKRVLDAGGFWLLCAAAVCISSTVSAFVDGFPGRLQYLHLSFSLL